MRGQTHLISGFILGGITTGNLDNPLKDPLFLIITHSLHFVQQEEEEEEDCADFNLLHFRRVFDILSWCISEAGRSVHTVYVYLHVCNMYITYLCTCNDFES